MQLTSITATVLLTPVTAIALAGPRNWNSSLGTNFDKRFNSTNKSPVHEVYSFLDARKVHCQVDVSEAGQTRCREAAKEKRSNVTDDVPVQVFSNFTAANQRDFPITAIDKRSNTTAGLTVLASNFTEVNQSDFQLAAVAKRSNFTDSLPPQVVSNSTKANQSEIRVHGIAKRSNVTGNVSLEAVSESTGVNKMHRPEITLSKRSNVTADLPVQVVYDFPTATWIENLAVRSNGQIIVTEDLRPRVYQVDPFGTREPILVHEFNETFAILGIVEMSPDVFYVNSANYSLQTLQGFGEAYIYKLDMRNFSVDQFGSAAKVSKVATLPQAQALNGLAFLGGNSTLLLTSDIILGVIWSVDVRTGETQIAINSTYTRSTRTGVNGLKVYNGSLYFTNLDQQMLVKVAINSKGEAVGNYTVLAQGGFEPDDFAFNVRGDTFVTDLAQDKGGLVFVPHGGGAATHIAGMAGATACAFGRTAADRDTLYVTTNGGLEGYISSKLVTVSGKVLKVNVGRNMTLQ